MSQAFRAGAARRRSALLVSTAALGLALSVPAYAEDTAGPLVRPDAIGPEAYRGAGALIDPTRPEPFSTTLPAQTFGITTIAPEPQILIANPGTPTTARDPANITGIGQMVVSNGGGSVGLCTGTLINPRMVIFAAHCVNSRTAGTYGANSGGVPIAFGFETNTRANAAGQPDELVQWLLAGPNQNKTNVAQAFYNANYVSYNPRSLEPNARGFLYADIATASLDTPAANIPTWALLFSQLPAVPITAAGTGYHVTIDGYGANGTGQTGSGGIDFRRRIAENTLGALASLDKFENFLFGTNSTVHPQNLYWIDFDDPRRGTPSASPFDFNAWRDNAFPNEGNTAGGDSGGPLILDRNFAKSLVIGVLSGGYTRFFNGQPNNGYGTAAFYQPLYLYWDWIAANNPYHYVGSLAGDANWTDPTHWITNLDPNYQIIVNGQLVSGIPTDVGAQTAIQPGFGQACFEQGGVSDCLDIATNVETVVVKPIGTAVNDPATVGFEQTVESQPVSDFDLAAMVDGRPGGTAVPQGVQGNQALPPATLASGLPGATNFVPNNFDGNRLTAAAPRYFDVTLGAAGTTTLNSAVVIDRFTMANAGATLDIQSIGSLSSLISITQMTGTMQVNGTLLTPGDYFMMAGGLNGTGTITSAFFTSAAGTISPGSTGAAGTLGQLTFRGNTIFASGTTLLIDLGTGSASDNVLVVTGAAGSGIANVGGRVLFSVATGSTPRAGNVYSILNAASVTGTFSQGSALSAILTPTISYTPNAVLVTLQAGLYTNVVSGTSPVQLSYARLLDQNRALAGASGLLGLYDVLDLQSVGTIQSTLEGLAPRTETLKTSQANAVVDNMSRFYRERLNSLNMGALGGSLAYIGKPLQAVQRATMPGQANMSNSFAGRGDDSGDSTVMHEGRLPENMSGFLAGGYLDGDSAPMRTAIPGGGRDQFDGYYIAGGIEVEMGSNGAIGFALSYSDIDGQTTLASQTASTKLYQGTLYSKANFGHAYVDGVLSAGLLSSRTARSATILATTYQLRSVDDALAVSGEVGLGAMFGNGIEFGPRVALRGSSIGFSRTNETGGLPALTLDRQTMSSIEGRAGFVVKGRGAVRPFGSASYVHEFQDRPTAFFANFVGGQGSNQSFALGGLDKDWFEVSGGLAIDTGPFELSVSADTTIDRDDVETQSYRGTIKFRF
ncbi:MAG TPA: autotransporter domain-containing protein [Novosphingobium sp.]|nr:autotransporter domain-containing protein [Novosphingobium sp.]